MCTTENYIIYAVKIIITRRSIIYYSRIFFFSNRLFGQKKKNVVTPGRCITFRKSQLAPYFIRFNYSGAFARRYCRQSRVGSARGTDKTIISIFFFLSILLSPMIIIISFFSFASASLIVVYTLHRPTVRRRLMDANWSAAAPTGWTADVLPPSIVSRSRQVVCLHRRCRCRGAYTRSRLTATAFKTQTHRRRPQ